MSETKQIDDGGSAFPIEGGEFSGLHPEHGMSLRDWFAGQALIGFTNAFISSGWHSPNEYQIEVLAKNAYVAADAMLAERAKDR